MNNGSKSFKRTILVIACLVVIALLLIQFGSFQKFGVNPFFKKETTTTKNNVNYFVGENAKYRVKAEGNFFYAYDNGKWNKEYFKGVNIGAGEPGIFPGELSISYEDYYRWFQEISAMNANCIRVYTAQRPQFYNALKDFNDQAENPLYLFQGVWVDEDDITNINDVYAENEQIMNNFIKDSKDLVDIIHGNKILPARQGYASGNYTADVSNYFAGWILGIEWDPKLVINSDNNNQGKKDYDGQYFYTLSASPFEAFLCRTGDEVVKYETEKYQFQSPVAFSNWVTTDPLKHPNEPFEDEDCVTVNVENIKTRNEFGPGQFASYHVYPYYPDSLNYQKDYINYTDDTGKVNTYEAYLKDLKLAHTMPIIVAEFGVPSSRGMGHKSIMGYDQGHVDETKQGEMIADMANSIYKSDYAGSLVFTWQDEWFKRTWNNQKLDVADMRPFWSNAQTDEQAFGILAFDPGKEKSVVYVDGKVDDWAGEVPIVTADNCKLYAKSDEKYLYLMANIKDFDLDNDEVVIPINTIANQGNFEWKDKNIQFDSDADFVVDVKGKDNTRIVVDKYYDSFYYLYGDQYKMIDEDAEAKTKNTGKFNNMQMCYNYEYTVPPENLTVPFGSFETGKLQFGNANPSASDYESLADFCVGGDNIEIKIPWQLLNVMDPSSKQIMNDIYASQGIVATPCDTFRLGMAVINKNESGSTKKIELTGNYTWQEWKQPTYHERLKPAYQVLQNAFKNFN